MTSDRRHFLSASAGAALFLTGCATGDGAARTDGEPAAGEPEVTPGEDLMREHGVLRRILFVYDDARTRLESSKPVPQDALASAAEMIRRVIEEYHEKIEEDLVFPRFERGGQLVDLVTVLREQHQKGREITDEVLRLTTRTITGNADREQLARALQEFNRMYRPHAAREDTVLFPAMRELVGDEEYLEMGERFEEREVEMLGEGGFEHAVRDIAKIEAQFGLADLASFTPS